MTHTPISPTHVPSTRAPSAEVTRTGAADEVEASPAATRAGGREPVLDNRFVLLEPLGEGGHAIVWRARDRLMRTMVAVKILRALDPDWRWSMRTSSSSLSKVPRRYAGAALETDE